MDVVTSMRAAGRLHPLVRLFAYLPLLGALLIGSAQAGRLSALAWGAYLGAGLLLWTLLEYLLHRHAFHWTPRSRRLRKLQRHLDHHAHPEDARNCVASLTFSLPVTLSVWLLLVLVSGSWQIGSVLTAGAILGYLFYELVHFATHFAQLEVQPFGFWRRYHFEHHRHASRCFGFTTPVWDLVFRSGPKGREGL